MPVWRPSGAPWSAAGPVTGNGALRRELRASVKILARSRIDVVPVVQQVLDTLDGSCEFGEVLPRVDDRPAADPFYGHETVLRYMPSRDRVASLTAAPSAPPGGLITYGPRKNASDTHLVSVAQTASPEKNKTEPRCVPGICDA